jgi:hypothetical protein
MLRSLDEAVEIANSFQVTDPLDEEKPRKLVSSARMIS